MSRPPADCCPDRSHVARGLCASCYRSARATGTLEQHRRKPKNAGNALRLAADRYRVAIPAIIGRDRTPYLVDARAAAARSMRHDAGMTLAAIGRALDGRDGTTVGNLLERDPGTPDPTRSPVNEKVCQVDGCDRATTHTQMCPGHRQRWVRSGRIRPEKPLRAILPDDAPVVDDPDVVHDRHLYNHGGCRCDTCRADAVRAVKLNRHQPQSRALERALAELRRLTDAGMSIPQISAAAGVGTATLYNWKKREVEVVYQRTIDKVAAVNPPSCIGGDACVDCGGEPMPGGALRCLPCFQKIATPRRSGCGTDAGYTAHLRAGTRPCQACREAHALTRELRQEAS